MGARAARVVGTCLGGFLLSGIVAIGLWEWVRHAPTSQCFGLASTSEIGLATFYTLPMTSLGAFSDPATAALLFLGVPLGLVVTGVVLASASHEGLGHGLVVLGWLAYGAVAFVLVGAGC